VFDGRQIEDAKGQELSDMIRYALNLQPYKIRVITDHDTGRNFSCVSWNQQQITTYSHLREFLRKA